MSSVNFAIPEPCLIHLTMKVRTATCAGASRHGCGAGIRCQDADCRWSLFSMRHRLVGQVIFAVDFRATLAASGKSPMRLPAGTCTDKSALRHVSGPHGSLAGFGGSCPVHRFKEEALVANEATSLSNERRSRLTLRISCDHLAIAPITFFVWKSEHRHGNIRWAIISKSREAHPYSVWGRPGNEISMMNTAIAFDKHNPSARIALKRTSPLSPVYPSILASVTTSRPVVTIPPDHEGASGSRPM
jgi:hypothetical protein